MIVFSTALRNFELVVEDDALMEMKEQISRAEAPQRRGSLTGLYVPTALATVYAIVLRRSDSPGARYVGEWRAPSNPGPAWFRPTPLDIEVMRDIQRSPERRCPQPLLLIFGPRSPNQMRTFGAYFFYSNEEWCELYVSGNYFRFAHFRGFEPENEGNFVRGTD